MEISRREFLKLGLAGGVALPAIDPLRLLVGEGLAFGQPLPSQQAAADAYLEDPEVRGIVMVLRDITERRAAEWARHEREAEYRQIVELSQEGLWTIDADRETNVG